MYYKLIQNFYFILFYFILSANYSDEIINPIYLT